MPRTNVKVRLNWEYENGYQIIAVVQWALIDAGHRDLAMDYLRDAVSRKYDNLVQLTMAYVEVEMSGMLPEMMRMAVTLAIEQLKARGGPSPDDMQKAQETSDKLGEHGDILLHGGGKPGETADLFNRTAHAIAVLSFVPGGVTLFGTTFEANPPKEA